MEFLGKKLEEKLWRDAGRREGWVRVVPQAVGECGVQPGLPRACLRAGAGCCASTGRSRTRCRRSERLLRGQTLNDLRGLYADRIYGFGRFSR